MQEPSNFQVVMMGMVTVFVCLILLIAVIMVMGKMMKDFSKSKIKSKEQTSALQSISCVENQKIVAAIGVAIAEELGTDVWKIKIHSIVPLI